MDHSLNALNSNGKFKIGEYYSNQSLLTSTIDKNRLLLSSTQRYKDYEDLVELSKDYAMSSNDFANDVFNRGTPFQDWIRANKATKTVKKNIAKWRIEGEADDRGTIMEDVTGMERPGLNGFLFNMKITLGHLHVGDQIWLMSHPNKGIVLKCQSGAQKSGAGYIYKWEYVTDDKGDWVDKKYITTGSYIMKAPSSYGEATKDAGSISFGASSVFTEFQTPLMKSRWSYTISDEALYAMPFIMVGYTDPATGKIDKSNAYTLHKLEGKALMSIAWEKELWDTYGRHSYTMIDGSSQKIATTSAGFFEYMEQGDRPRYNPEVDGMPTISSKIEAKWAGRTPKGQQEMTLNGGKMFLKYIDRVIREEYGNDAFRGNFSFDPSGAKSFHNDPKVKGYGYKTYQFTQYFLQPWGTLNFGHWEMLDDKRLNVIPAHKGEYPASSWEAFSFDAVNSGKLNVLKLIKEFSEKSHYISGTVGGGGEAAHMGDYQTWVYQITTGLAVGNMHNTFWLRPDYV